MKKKDTRTRVERIADEMSRVWHDAPGGDPVDGWDGLAAWHLAAVQRARGRTVGWTIGWTIGNAKAQTWGRVCDYAPQQRRLARRHGHDVARVVLVKRGRG